MPTPASVTLVVEAGRNPRTLVLEGTDEGGVRLTGYDRGPIVRETFGRDDYEYWLTIAPDGLQALAMALIAERALGKGDAFVSLEQLCKDNDVSFSHGSW